MKIVTWPSGKKILSTKCKDITVFDEDLLNTVKEMQSIIISTGAIGLAAPQVGILHKIIICLLGNEVELTKKSFEVMVNPEIIEYSTETVKSIEGCLSLPGVKGVLKDRSIKITASYFNAEDGMPVQKDFTAMDAIVVQHEVDHINGLTLLNHMKGTKKLMASNKLKKIDKLIKKNLIRNKRIE
jgi:peptide deformylase